MHVGVAAGVEACRDRKNDGAIEGVRASAASAVRRADCTGAAPTENKLNGSPLLTSAGVVNDSFGVDVGAPPGMLKSVLSVLRFTMSEIARRERFLG